MAGHRRGVLGTVGTPYGKPFRQGEWGVSTGPQWERHRGAQTWSTAPQGPAAPPCPAPRTSRTEQVAGSGTSRRSGHRTAGSPSGAGIGFLEGCLCGSVKACPATRAGANGRRPASTHCGPCELSQETRPGPRRGLRGGPPPLPTEGMGAVPGGGAVVGARGGACPAMGGCQAGNASPAPSHSHCVPALGSAAPVSCPAVPSGPSSHPCPAGLQHTLLHEGRATPLPTAQAACGCAQEESPWLP